MVTCRHGKEGVSVTKLLGQGAENVSQVAVLSHSSGSAAGKAVGRAVGTRGHRAQGWANVSSNVAAKVL